MLEVTVQADRELEDLDLLDDYPVRRAEWEQRHDLAVDQQGVADGAEAGQQVLWRRGIEANPLFDAGGEIAGRRHERGVTGQLLEVVVGGEGTSGAVGL